jgi:hypothetical protein
MASTAFVDGSTLTAAAWFNDVDGFVYGVLSSVSGTNTIAGTGPVSMTGYAAGQRFWFTPANTNNGAATINITPSGGAALGEKDIYLGGVALVAGELRANIPTLIFYDGTRFHILGPYSGGYIPLGVTLPNNVALQARNSTGTAVDILVMDANNIPFLRNGATSEVVRIPTIASPPASAAARLGGIIVDGTNANRLIFYDKDGNRFYIEGTTF